jgi:5-formyltetrahydrofolate cyclo-ligase
MSGLDLSPDELRELTRRVKKQLRSRMRGTRRALPATAVSARSACVIERLNGIEAFRRADAVGLFWPIEGHGEVDLRALDRELDERGVARYYPFMDPKGPNQGYSTGFRRIEEPRELMLRGQKFAEPPRDAKVASRGDVDVVLVPALAVTPEGHRLGQGIGFYDATLPDLAPPALTIIVGFSFQLLAELPLEPHDFECDAVVTDREIIDPRGRL